jgi:hypothetical protein
LAFFEEDAEGGDFGVGDGGGVDEVAGEFEVLFEDGLEEGVCDAEGVCEDGAGDGCAGGWGEGEFFDGPFAVEAAEVEVDAVAAGFVAVEFEGPTGEGIEFDFADFADAVGLADADGHGGGEVFEAGEGCGVEGVFADEFSCGGEVSGFEGFSDAVDEVCGVDDGESDAEVFEDLFGVVGDGCFVDAFDGWCGGGGWWGGVVGDGGF